MFTISIRAPVLSWSSRPS